MKDKILEKFNNNDIVINVKTREEYDNLMKYLEDKGFRWASGELPTSSDVFPDYDKNTCIKIENRNLHYCNMQFSAWANLKVISYQEFMEMFGETNGLGIKKIIVNKDTTIIFWKDDTKTIVRKDKDQKDNKELAILYAYFIKTSGLSKTQAKKELNKLINSITYQPKVKGKNVDDKDGFKVGDKVRTKDGLIHKKSYGELAFYETMKIEKQEGETISNIMGSCIELENGFTYTSEMLELVGGKK